MPETQAKNGLESRIKHVEKPLFFDVSRETYSRIMLCSFYGKMHSGAISGAYYS